MSSLKRKRFSPQAKALARARPSKRYKRTTPLYSSIKELKFLDTKVASFHNTSPYGIQDSGSIFPTVLACPQGISESERIGRKLTVKSLHFNYRAYIGHHSAYVGQDPTVRFIVYLDKQANGTAATTTDILESAHFQSFRNLSNKDRFTILHDKVTLLAPTFGGEQPTYNGSFHKRMNIPVEYSGTTGALTELRSNNIGVLVIQDGVTTPTSTEFISFLGTFRVRYEG